MKPARQGRRDDTSSARGGSGSRGRAAPATRRLGHGPRTPGGGRRGREPGPRREAGGRARTRRQVPIRTGRSSCPQGGGGGERGTGAARRPLGEGGAVIRFRPPAASAGAK